MSWSDLDREHLIRVGLAMTPAERLRWLEDTVEELLPWVGLARQGRGLLLPKPSASPGIHHAAEIRQDVAPYDDSDPKRRSL